MNLVLILDTNSSYIGFSAGCYRLWAVIAEIWTILVFMPRNVPFSMFLPVEWRIYKIYVCIVNIQRY